MKLTKPQREQIRLKCGGHCSYCGVLLTDKWHADHMIAVRREGQWIKLVGRMQYVQTGKQQRPQHDTLENLWPACVPCNIDKSDAPLEAWRNRLMRSHEVLLRNYSTYKHAHRFGLIKPVTEPLVFYFERMRRRVKVNTQSHP